MSSPEQQPTNGKLDAKKARRKFRHEIMRRMKRVATRRTGLCATTGQLKAQAKLLTDRYMHAVDHMPVKADADPTKIPERQTA